MGISNLYAEYAKLESELAVLEMKKEQLRPHIIEMMKESGTDKEDIGVGKFSLSIRTQWKYPERIVEMEDAVKAAKAKAQSTGEAEAQEFDQLRYTAAKL